MPLWLIKLLIGGAVLAALAGGFTAFVAHERGIGAAKATAALEDGYRIGFAKAAKEALDRQIAKNEAKDKSHAQDLIRASERIAAGAAARDELERLRDRLRRPGPTAASAPAAAGPVPDVTAPYRRVADECSVRYEAVEGTARQLRDQVIGLQGYVRALFVGEPNQIEGNSPVGERPRADAPSVTQPTTGSPGSEGASAVPPIAGAAK
jgi:hypothetical protein